MQQLFRYRSLSRRQCPVVTFVAVVVCLLLVQLSQKLSPVQDLGTSPLALDGIGGVDSNGPYEQLRSEHNPTPSRVKPGNAKRKLTKEEYLEIVKMSHNTDQDTEIRAAQKDRRSRLSAFCRRKGHQRPLSVLPYRQKRSVLKHLLVSDKYRFLYCYTPKVACANWKKVLKVLDEKAIHPNHGTLNHMKDVKFLVDYSPAEIELRLRTYYKFTFVREPMSRLVSAFINKFHEIKDFQRRYGVALIKKYRRKPPAFTKGDDVTFEEFVRSLLDTDPGTYNEHWMSVENLCQPCSVDYDFIGAHENLLAEANFVIRQVHASERVAFPVPQRYYKPLSSKNVSDMFSILPRHQRNGLVKLFENDFSMFDYPIPE